MTAAADPRVLTPLVSPSGELRCAADPQADPLPQALAERIAHAFESGAGEALLLLGAAGATLALPPAWAWWRDFAARYWMARCTQGDERAAVAPPDDAALAALIADAAPMTGAEYLTPKALHARWLDIDAALGHALDAAGQTLGEYLQTLNPAWNLVGRVHFNLAENRKDPEAPFAFLATYTTRLSAHGKAQHLPLAQALTEYSGGRRKAQLLSLLQPVQRAAEQCTWVADMVESGEIYHPLRWQPADAIRLLNDLPTLEAAGIVARMPAQWHAGRPARPKVRAALGGEAPSALGLDALLDFDMGVSLDGEPLTDREIRSLLAGSDGLQWLRGRWVEVDRARLSRTLDRFRAIARAAQDGVPLAQAIRLLAGAALDDEPIDRDWSDVVAGDWLAEALRALRAPAVLDAIETGPAFTATLRPYQQDGVRWLALLTRLGLGACLADDMGLGKTIQVLALLSALKREAQACSLLVAPASLLANWMQEAERFAPGLRCLVAHPAWLPRDELRDLGAAQLANVDLVITSYGSLMRLPHLTDVRWRIVIADEAQAIKNPGAKQTKHVKKLAAGVRIALTGTPVENRLTDLWSIFDFTHPGLLGGQRAFAGFTKRLAERGNYGPLRSLVSPYILRRLKSDRRVIADLPDKTETTAFCTLSATQAAHYRTAVTALARAIANTEGIERKGLVLAYLMRFKQICNHPSQWLGDGGWLPEASGKFGRLAEIAETIAARQEKLLVFTQFQETVAPLAAFLGGIFGREGVVLHGGTPVAKRRHLVQRFQDDERVPFFVLSIKAGGSGLNLTAASHVVHFDRWWNPAVENQATDRAYRIGQKRNVLVHKFVCRGTIEERIDEMIRAKQSLADDVIGAGIEVDLTAMSDSQLLDLVRLDINTIEE